MGLPSRLPSRGTIFAVLSSFGLLAMAFASLPAGAATSCDFVVANNGSDAAQGTAQAPFQTPDRLATALGPGQTGCVRGTVSGDMDLYRAGVTLTSEPGQRGKIVGRLVVHENATGTTISDLDLDGRTSPAKPGPIILADDAVVRGNDITNEHTEICLIIGAQGHDSGALAERVRIENNRIHDCGVLPAANHDHGIYAEHTLDLRVVGNEIFDNADRAVQLYPNAQRSYIAGNVMDNNGEGVIFSGASGLASSDNVVEGNIITNNQIRSAIEDWYPDGNPVGTNNVARSNCVFGGRLISKGRGFTATANLETDPLYVNRATKDFTLRFDSPCAGLLEAARAGAAIPTPTAPPQPNVTAAPTPRITNRVVKLDGEHKLAVEVTPPAGDSTLAAVKLRVVSGKAKAVDTKIAFRFGARAWKQVGRKRVSKNRKTVIRLRAPRGTRALTLRAKTRKTRRAATVRFKLA